MEESESQINGRVNGTAKSSISETCMVVGIGASAGGIQALREFFRQVDENSGMAYVVILHLSPNYDSQLAEVLQIATKLPVTKVTERVNVHANHIYVISPNASLKMWDNQIRVEAIHTVEERRAPVDIFFRTLAESHGSLAAAVILSGTGADGSMGLKRVKEKGGVVYVQSPHEAEYSDMPRNAIATDLVDEVLNVAGIPAKLLAYKNNIGKVEIPIAPEEQEEKEQAALREIFSQLRVRTGHDFINYKRATIMRRIERRINVRSIASLPEYVSFLHENPDESQSLLKDLLISVTNFFRDQKAFEYLEKQIIPELLKNKTPDNTLRVWVAGCATGEEAYSIAMLLNDELGNQSTGKPSIQIFATDIDDAAIATAREGFYTLNDAADVSQERLQRYFTSENGGYRVKKEIRETILFANHNVLKDPPFSRLHLITCRNMLIYFNQTAQNRVMETFHFALKPGGFLFLGSSESITGANDLFATVSRDFQVYQSRNVKIRPIPVPENSLIPEPKNSYSQKGIHEMKTTSRMDKPISQLVSLGDLHQRLLEQYAPPSVLINENYEVLHISENAGRYMQIAGGEPSSNLFKIILPELRIELRAAVLQALQKSDNVEIKDTEVTVAGVRKNINIYVRPVLRPTDMARGFVLILFEPSEEPMPGSKKEIVSAETQSLTLHLEDEVTKLSSQLHSSNELYEVQTEELKASNEELQAMNEELRSSTEELETSKEELQSINEELLTVNQELKVKIEEVSQSNNNFKNLINSSDIGTIFLDHNFRVRLFTPAIKKIFNLIQMDIGRPLSDITGKIGSSEVLADVETVMQTLQTLEREISLKEGDTFLMRILPYRTAEDLIRGVVIVFINITQRKKTEEDLRGSDERMRLLAESATDFALITLDAEGKINNWNTGAGNLFGWQEHEILGKPGAVLFTEEDRRDSVPHQEMQKTLNTGRSEDERWHLKKDGSRFFASGVMSLLKDGKGFAKIARDMTGKIEHEWKLKDNEERYRIALEAGDLATWDWNVVTNKVVWNEQHSKLLGLINKHELVDPKYFLQFIHPDDLHYVKQQLADVLGPKGRYAAEFRIIRQDDQQLRWMTGYGRVTERENGNPVRISGVMSDTTDRRQAADKLLETKNSLNTALEAAQMGVWNMNLTTGIVDRSARHDQLLGYPEWQETWTKEMAKQYIDDNDKDKFDLAYSNLFSNGIFELEARVNPPDGNKNWIYYYGCSFKDEDGKTERAAGVIFDITDRKTVEKQKDDFIGIASHELKTPVTSIKAYAGILQEIFTDANDLRAADMMNKLDRQVDRLTNLIKDLLDVTKVSEGQLHLKKQLFSIENLTTEVVEEMQRTSRQHAIKLSLSKLPDVTGDKERIGQVLTNLISNAIKYSPDSKDIEVVANYNDGQIEISVRDFGIGMTDNTLSRLFQRFYRSDNPLVLSYPGLGLGLFISMEIMKRHQGSISVESEKGKGSTFTMHLPKG